MAQQCTSCNIDLAEDPSRGELFCPRCGEVFEENRVVAEIGFQESGGGVAVVGQRIPTGSDSARTGQTTESREASLAKGNAKIEWVGQLLKLSNHIQEAAKRIFLLAVQRNFTKGRRTVHVAAACLYVQCRLNKTPHMLIDFSDCLQASVRVLGQCYMKLVRLLNLDNQVAVPLIDPSFFMERFAAALRFGEKQQKVARTAVRLVQAMKRDWIVTGRRPTGLCGAALMISCQYHGFERSATEIGDVVRIAENTLKKRLFEFRQTSTAALSTEEFEKLDLKPADNWSFDALPSTDALPPSLVKNRHKEVKLQALKDEQERLLALEDAGAAAASGSKTIKNEGDDDIKVVAPLALEDGKGDNNTKIEPKVEQPVNLEGPIVLDALNESNFEEPKADDIAAIAKNMAAVLAQRAAAVEIKEEKVTEPLLKLEDGDPIEGVIGGEASSSAAQNEDDAAAVQITGSSNTTTKKEIGTKKEKIEIKDEGDAAASASSRPVKVQQQPCKTTSSGIQFDLIHSIDSLFSHMPSIQPENNEGNNQGAAAASSSSAAAASSSQGQNFAIKGATGNVLAKIKGSIVGEMKFENYYFGSGRALRA